MSAALLRLIVLGKIPGTDIEVSFWIFFGILAPAASLLLVLVAIKITRKIGHSINPFYGAPRSLSRIDLIAL